MKLKLCIIGFFFCLIAAIGWVTISDTEMPIPLPMMVLFLFKEKAIFQITKYTKWFVIYQNRKRLPLQAHRSEFGSVEVCKF